MNRFVLILLTTTSVAFADLVITDPNATYSQNFDSLISSGSSTWTNNGSIADWYAQRTGTGTGIAADTGSGTGGNLYSYGSASSSDRALGSLGSANAAAGSFAWGLVLRNSTGLTITNFSLSYVGELWRAGTIGTSNIITFSYQSASGTPATDLTPGSDTGWTLVSSLNFTSPVPTGTTGARDGNASGNNVSVSGNIAVNLADGDYLTLRWRDIDHAGTDQGLGIDNVSLSWSVVPEPASVSMLLLGLVGARGVMHRRKRT